MNYSIKYLAIFCTSLVIATGCGVADTNDEDAQERLNQVIFISDIEGSDDLYLANVDGTEQKRITNNDLQESFPSVSPDGSKVAYSQQGEIWIALINGSQPTKVTDDDCNDEGRCIEPSWSPNGDKLTYSRNGDIYITNIDGTETLNITESDEVSEYAPKWSPDGSEIAFTQQAQSAVGPLDTEIFVIDTETLEQTQLTDNEFEDEHAAWSPDGTELVLLGTDAEGRVRLYIYNTREASRTAFTDLEEGRLDSEASPCWGTDNYIYFTTVNVGTTDANGNAKAKATSHNASRSNRSNGIVSDIITNGDIRGVTCARELDKSSTL
ncbi:MAG: DPP IV N-terminal domain-containing protein [Balneola sp.]